MSQFRKLPVVIEAVQWHADPRVGIPGMDALGVEYTADGYRYIRTLNGPVRIYEGEWLITGVQGERYPVKDQIFKQTYETVEPTP